jgi:hypothetical protein
MTWQDLGVLLVVAGAVLFLLRRMLPGRQKAAQTFVPLDAIKHRREHDKGCH